jgi:hypothetical protein
MSPRLAPFLLVAVVGGCQCLEPVSECPRRGCHFTPSDAGGDAGLCVAWDGGGTFTGARDGGPDAGPGFVFLGDTCDDQLVTLPVTTPGVFTSLAACVRCGCDEKKFAFVGPATDAGFTTTTVCESLQAVTTSPDFVRQAFPDVTDAGCTTAGCTVWTGSKPLGADGRARACAASLVTNVSSVRCLVVR